MNSEKLSKQAEPAHNIFLAVREFDETEEAIPSVLEILNRVIAEKQ